MRIIALGDTHGHGEAWRYVVQNEQFDKLVFIGDYWDSFDVPFKQQAENFLDIVEYKRNNTDKVVLLIGNHDYHYMKAIQARGREIYSGFQGVYRHQIGELLELSKEYLQIAYEHEDTFFTHAGLTMTWLKGKGWYERDKGQSTSEFLNELFINRPWSFCFDGHDGHGDDITQGPLWVRPASLKFDGGPMTTQVVGHTGQKEIDLSDPAFYFIDTLGTSGEYLIIDDTAIATKSFKQ